MGIQDRDYMKRKFERPLNEPKEFPYAPEKQEIKSQAYAPLIWSGLIGVAISAAYFYSWNSSSRSSSPANFQPQQPQLVQPAQVGQNNPLYPTQEFPPSGTTQWYKPIDPRQQSGILRIMDTSDLPGNKLVRIRDAFGSPVVQVYIRNQEGAELFLPLGIYAMNIASGTEWHGVDEQFGRKVHFYQASNIPVIAGEVNYRILPGTEEGDALQPIKPDSF